MSQSEYYSNNAKTALTAGYTAGSGSITVTSTAGNFPTSVPFHVSIYDDTTSPPTLKVILEVTAITDSTHFAVTAEGTDANASSGNNVYQCLTKVAIDRIKTDAGTVGNLTGLGTGVGTFLGTPTSANLKAALTDETGSGAAVFATSPTLVTPALGTPASGDLRHCTFGTPWDLSITDPTLTTFSWRNQGSATVTSRNNSIWLTTPPHSGTNIVGREIAAPSTPWSITVGLLPLTFDQQHLNAGLYVSDGTKIVNCGVGNAAGLSLFVAKYSSVTSFSANYSTPSWRVNPSPVFIKVVNNGTTLVWYVSVNGLDFLQILSATVTDFLASASFVGMFVNSENATWPVGALFVSWVQGTS